MIATSSMVSVRPPPTFAKPGTLYDGDDGLMYRVPPGPIVPEHYRLTQDQIDHGGDGTRNNRTDMTKTP